jgi:hypothetical protein
MMCACLCVSVCVPVDGGTDAEGLEGAIAIHIYNSIIWYGMVCKCAFVSSVDIVYVSKRRTRSVSSWVLHIG